MIVAMCCRKGKLDRTEKCLGYSKEEVVLGVGTAMGVASTE